MPHLRPASLVRLSWPQASERLSLLSALTIFFQLAYDYFVVLAEAAAAGGVILPW